MISTKMIGEEFSYPPESFITYLEEKHKRILREVSVLKGTPVLREDQKSENQKEETFANRLPKEPRHGAQSPLNINKISPPISLSVESFTRNFRSSSPLLIKTEPPVQPNVVELYGSPSQLEDAVHKHLTELMIFHQRLHMQLDTHKNSRPILLAYVADRLGFLLSGILLPYVKRTALLPYDNDFRSEFYPAAARGMRIVKSDSHPLRAQLVDGPLASLCFPTSSEVNWTTPSHLVDLGPPVFNDTLEASRNGNVTKFCEHMPVLTEHLTNMVRRFPLSPSLCYFGEKLDNVELVHLKNFIKEFEVATGGVEETHLESAVWGIRSIEVEDQMVSEVGNFAIDAFNKACEMHVKKGDHNILQHFEFMECKYFRVSCSYYFYIAIEAIEEGNPGAYVAEVAWNLSNGARSLCKFVLTNYKPYGTLATSVFYLSSLEALVKTLCDFYEEKQTRLISLLPILEVTQVPTSAREADRLQKIHLLTMEDLRQNLSRDTKVLLPPDCNRKTNPARWTDPDNVYGSGMVRRVGGTTCGYDYYNPYVGTGRPEEKIPNSFM